jgi:uncharacterized membrane protein
VTEPPWQRPTHDDPVVTSLSEAVGGPAGEHARPHRWWTPVRVLLALFTLVFALALVQKYPCGETHWSDTDVRYGKMCYSDIPYLYTGRGFAEHRWPYATDDGRYPVMEYPVGISYLAWGVSEVIRPLVTGPAYEIRSHLDPDQLWGLPGMAQEVNEYFLLSALALFLCGLGAVLFLAGASPGRPWEAAAFAVSPVLLVTALVNWDLLAVLFTAGALWAFARGRPGLTGVMIGLGTAAKLYPAFLLGAVLVDVLWAARHRRTDLRTCLLRFAGCAAAAVATWLLVNLPAMISGPDAWRVFWRFNTDRGADLGSLWLVLTQHGVAVPTAVVNDVSTVVFALACVAILVLGIRAPTRPRMAQIGFLVVAAFLLVNKVYSPQYVLWLLPLAVLARPRWRDLLIWQAGELLYFGAVWLYLGGWLEPAAGGPVWAYHLAILLRVGAELYLVALVVRDVARGSGGHVTRSARHRVPARAGTLAP